MNGKGEILIIAAIVLSIYGAGMYFVIQDGKICDERVFLKDGTTIDCISTQSYDSGMTQIKMCSGERMQIPTPNIAKIKEIKIK